MTNSEAGRKAFEEVFSKWEDPNDKNKAWKGWRAGRASVLAMLESPECAEEVAVAIAFHQGFTWDGMRDELIDRLGVNKQTFRGTAQAAISTIVNKLKEKLSVESMERGLKNLAAISTALKSGEQPTPTEHIQSYSELNISPTSEPVKVHPALLACAEILEKFHNRDVSAQDTVEDKLLQWQACYAMLFKQLNDASCVIREQDKQIKIMREALLEKSIKPT